MRSQVKKLLSWLGYEIRRNPEHVARRALEAYERTGRRPWSPGYLEHRARVIAGILDSPETLQRFRRRDRLAAEHGIGVDERCVEYPWLFANLSDARGPKLDAGSTLNHAFIVNHPLFRASDWTFATLAPEQDCFWKQGISYAFCDLRDLPFRDEHFVEATCLSTFEHVGMDNSGYTNKESDCESSAEDFLRAARELRRVLRPGGRLLFTVPFGKYQNFGWQQQFDAAMLDRLVEAFGPATAELVYYRYDSAGWQIASRDECATSEFSHYTASLHLPEALRRREADADQAAAARSVACGILVKPATKSPR